MENEWHPSYGNPSFSSNDAARLPQPGERRPHQITAQDVARTLTESATTVERQSTVDGGYLAAVNGRYAAAVAASDAATVTTRNATAVATGDSAAVASSYAAAVASSDTATVTTGDTATVTSSDTATVTTGDTAAVTTGDTAAVASSDAAAVTTGDTAAVASSDAAAVTTGDTAAVASSDAAAVTSCNALAVTSSDAAAVASSDAAAITGSDAVRRSTNKRYSDIAAVLALNRLRNHNALHYRTSQHGSNADRVVDSYIQVLGPGDSSNHAKRQGRSKSIDFLHLYIPILPNQRSTCDHQNVAVPFPKPKTCCSEQDLVIRSHCFFLRSISLGRGGVLTSILFKEKNTNTEMKTRASYRIFCIF